MKKILDVTNINRAHLVTKGTLWIWNVNQVHLVNIEKKNWVSVYREKSANEGFSNFGILSSIDLVVGSSRLGRWILSILSCIQVDLTMYKI